MNEPTGRLVLVTMASLFAVLAALFAQMTVSTEEGRLLLRYGPLPVFGWQFRLSDIESVEVGHTTWIDGWGMHWIPGRGTTFNLWGFDCVVVKVKGKTVRIGTDDAEDLSAFLRSHIALPSSEQGDATAVAS